TLPRSHLAEIFASKEFAKLQKRPFEQVATLQRGFDLTAAEREPGPFPVITSSGKVRTHKEFRAKGPGVLTGRSGSVGRVHYVETDYWPHNTALFVKHFHGNHPRYIYYLVQWLDVASVSSGTGVPTLDRKQIHKLQIPNPPVERQRQIAGILDALTA